MRAVKDSPVLTETYAQILDFEPQSDSTYIFAQSGEERSVHFEKWQGKCPTVSLKQLIATESREFHVKGAPDSIYRLRSELDLVRFWKEQVASDLAYIDITGLTHSMWAALLRTGLALGKKIIVVYVEPSLYKHSAAPREGHIYDLSVSIAGIAPLPGFAFLSDRSDDDFTLIALLGFEGTRLSHMIEHIQPQFDRIFPVIGCPGFKPWYIFEAYVGNKRVLWETRAWHEARYAPGNCPFSCYYLLEDIASSRGKSGLKIALVGTKPHALGAVLFYLASDTPVELVYDHPTRSDNRTDGTERLLTYHVSTFLDLGGLPSAPKKLQLRVK